MNTKVLEAQSIVKYFLDPVKLKVLSEVSFSIEKGSFVSIAGKSGCGKSTLLYILSTMDTNYEGRLFLDEVLLTGKPATELARVRNEKIGVVFQFHYLIQEFSVLRNIMLPALKLGKLPEEQIEFKALQQLEKLGIKDQAMKFPNQLSGGQKQRVAIARALINDPVIIMGDEPTGNLDKVNSDLVFDIFRQLNRERQLSILVVTHDQDFARRSDRIIQMEDGRIISGS